MRDTRNTSSHRLPADLYLQHFWAAEEQQSESEVETALGPLRRVCSQARVHHSAGGVSDKLVSVLKSQRCGLEFPLTGMSILFIYYLLQIIDVECFRRGMHTNACRCQPVFQLGPTEQDHKSFKAEVDFCLRKVAPVC